MSEHHLARCRCGAVEAAATGKPIIANVCYCADCQVAARLIAARPTGASETTPDGGTECLVFRKDRVTVIKGAERLEALRLKEGATTRRMIASCCNTGMYVAFDDAKPWVSAFRARFVGEVPPVEMRICTKYRRAEEPLDDRLPNHPGYPLEMMLRILAAWIPMLFAPKTEPCQHCPAKGRLERAAKIHRMCQASGLAVPVQPLRWMFRQGPIPR